MVHTTFQEIDLLENRSARGANTKTINDTLLFDYLFLLPKLSLHYLRFEQ